MNSDGLIAHLINTYMTMNKHTEERFGLENIGAVTEDHLIDFLPGQEENLWPGKQL